MNRRMRSSRGGVLVAAGLAATLSLITACTGSPTDSGTPGTATDTAM